MRRRGLNLAYKLFIIETIYNIYIPGGKKVAKISIVGTGYVGLVSGAMFASLGHHVICCDIDSRKIDALNQGVVPIYEEGLPEIISSTVQSGHLVFTTEIDHAIVASDVIFIAVGTPPLPDGNADLSFIYSVAETIGKHIDSYKVVVDKSTVPIGTSREVTALIQRSQCERGVDIPFEVVSNPEFLREGTGVYDFSHPDRIVIGCRTQKAFDIMQDVYRSFSDAGIPVLKVLPETAEMIKYASNSFLAVKIAYINEIAYLCEKTGADVSEVSHAMGLDERIAPAFLQPGPGYGGSCFPKDTLALCSIADSCNASASIIQAAIDSNEAQKLRMVTKIKKGLGNLSGKVLAILGVAFKPETDDMRCAPSLTIIPRLIEAGAKIKVFDPQAMENAQTEFLGFHGLIDYCEDEYAACKDADAIILLTHWAQFNDLDYSRIRENMHGDHFYDLRNMLDGASLKEKGYQYYCVGKKSDGH